MRQLRMRAAVAVVALGCGLAGAAVNTGSASADPIACVIIDQVDLAACIEDLIPDQLPPPPTPKI